MDPAWIGVIGTAIGALAAGVPAVINTIIQRGAAKAQRDHEAAEAKAKREHEAAEKRRTERQEQIKEWRSGLEESHAAYQQWLIKEDEKHAGVPPRTTVVRAKDPVDEPNAVSTVWFQRLRRHISETGDAAKYRNADEVHCDTGVVVILSSEIDRIEREWLDGEKS